MSERPDAPATREVAVMRVPVDMVEFESRLTAIERRLTAFESREERLLELIEAVKRLTEVVGPLVAPQRPRARPERRNPDWPLPGARPASAGPVAPERIALAHARLRETLFAAPPPAPEVAPPPPGRRSWVLRSLKRMVKHDPDAAGAILAALVPAHGLAGIPPFAALPGPPRALARVLVAGRVRRRIRWEKERLECGPSAVAAIAPLVRLRATPAQLLAAGVRLEPRLAFALVAFALERGWTAGHDFTIAHRGPDRVTYLTVRGRAWPAVGTERAPAPVATTIVCLDDALAAVLAGDPPAGVTILGAVAPLELVQRWLVRAASA